MQRFTLAILSGLLIASLSACSSPAQGAQDSGASQAAVSQTGTPQVEAQKEMAEPAVTENRQETAKTESGSGQNENGASSSPVLIAYFSRVGNTDFPDGVDAVSSASLMVKDGGLMGNTQYVASLIEQNTDGDLFLIETVEKYPADYDATDRQGGIENQERPRPALASHVESMEDYNIVFLGFPNWYYDMPMAVYTFLDEYDLSGKTIVPFSTSGGGGFSNTISAIRELEPGATVLTDGFTVTHSRVENTTAEDVADWIAGLNLPIQQ